MSMLLTNLIVILIAISSAVGQEIKCSNDTRVFDTIVTDYFLLAAPTRKFPTNPDQLKKFCDDNSIISSKIKAYANTCMDKLLRRLISLAVYSIDKTNANMCRSRRRSTELMAMGKCGNAVNKQHYKCWANWIKGSNGISEITEARLRLPLVCCITFTLNNCFTTNYENEKNCDTKSKKGMENLFGAYLTNTLKLMCGDYTESDDKCDRIVSQIPESNSKSMSPIAILSSLFEGIPDE